MEASWPQVDGGVAMTDYKFAGTEPVAESLVAGTHNWVPAAQRAMYRCTLCGAIKQKSMSRFRNRTSGAMKADAPCRGLSPEPVPAIPAGPRKPSVTPPVFVELMMLLLGWRDQQTRRGSRYTTADHLRQILEKVGMISERQGKNLFKDTALQRYFKRQCAIAEGYDGSTYNDLVSTTKLPLLVRVPDSDFTNFNSMKMLRSYSVLVTDAGLKQRAALEEKYLDTSFRRDVVLVLEDEMRVFWDAKREAARAAVIERYRDKVTKETAGPR